MQTTDLQICDAIYVYILYARILQGIVFLCQINAGLVRNTFLSFAATIVVRCPWITIIYSLTE